MPRYIVTYDTGETQRIDAARVSYDPSETVYAFYGEDDKEVAWVSVSDARSVVLSSALDQGRSTQAIR